MSVNPRIKSIEKATGRPWSEWMDFMKQIGAVDLDHKSIADMVNRKLEGQIDSPSWWAQGITVTYEQESGRRLPGQRADGTFSVSLSRATPLSMTDLMQAWSDFVAKDKAVLKSIEGQVRTGGTSNRLRWSTRSADGSTIVVTSEPKPNHAASLVVQLEKLKDMYVSGQAKEQWVGIVDRFMAGL